MSYFNGPQVSGGMPPMDPNAYAQRYAQENGISLDDAKNQLRARFGDPQKPNSTFAPEPQNIPRGAIGPVFSYRTDGANFNYNASDFRNINPQEMEKLVEQEAKRNGMSPQDFAYAIGLPPRQEPQEDKNQMLIDLGIPQNVIAQGDDAIRKYAEQNNINLPPKER